MERRIGVIGTGEMGSGVAAQLVRHGATVCTTLQGRSAASAERIHRAGIPVVDDLATMARTCTLVLSIVPPNRALAAAQDFVAAHAGVAGAALLYADCNAVAPATARAVGATIEAAGMRFVDAGIIGAAPREGSDGPHIYASGAYTAEFAELNAFGLQVRPLDGPIGFASALKMSYAGITKAWTGIGAAMFAHAERSGVGAALAAEFSEHLPALDAWLAKQIPTMYPKAYRWVGEMREIGSFAGDEPAIASIYEGLAQYYTAIAETMATKGRG